MIFASEIPFHGLHVTAVAKRKKSIAEWGSQQENCKMKPSRVQLNSAGAVGFACLRHHRELDRVELERLAVLVSWSNGTGGVLRWTDLTLTKSGSQEPP